MKEKALSNFKAKIAGASLIMLTKEEGPTSPLNKAELTFLKNLIRDYGETGEAWRYRKKCYVLQDRIKELENEIKQVRELNKTNGVAELPFRLPHQITI